MAEYIDREKLKADLIKRWIDNDDQDFCNKEVWHALEEAPAADVVERKTGKWISYIEDGYLECPFCGAATNCDGDESELHFCFSCGAKMESPTDV